MNWKVSLRTVAQDHFARMWPNRHDPVVRYAIKDNIKVQRQTKA